MLEYMWGKMRFVLWYVTFSFDRQSSPEEINVGETCEDLAYMARDRRNPISPLLSRFLELPQKRSSTPNIKLQRVLIIFSKITDRSSSSIPPLRKRFHICSQTLPSLLPLSRVCENTINYQLSRILTPWTPHNNTLLNKIIILSVLPWLFYLCHIPRHYCVASGLT